MLRITESRSSSQAKRYYSTSDYYTEGQELEGYWRGQAASRLGLSGPIQANDWEALCDNQHAQTGDKLTLRQKEIRPVGYDFNFHVPKSYSLLYAMTQDERLLEAFRESVDETMREMEAELKTRVRKRGGNEDRETANAVWGEFIHFTSRPVDEIPDPHLHVHCFVFNATWDEQEQSWKAGQFGDLKRDSNYFEGRFHVRLTHKLAELGLPVERTRTGWEIQGFAADTLKKFSRRTTQIEREALEKGITDPAQKSELGAKTRQRKQKDLSMTELRREWASRLSDEERDSLERTAANLGQSATPDKREEVPVAIRRAAQHVFERKSVVPERTLLAETFKRAVGTPDLATVEQHFAQEEFLTKERGGRRMTTTATVLAEERAMLDFARQGRGSCRSLGKGSHQFQREWLNADQRRAVQHVLTSTDRVMVIRGKAGVGKTSMMQEAVEACEAGGHQVIPLAPTARASRGVLKAQEFEQADTLSRLLCDPALQAKIQDQVVWVDEAGLIGSN